MKTCNVKGCDKKHHAKGYCNKHYLIYYRRMNSSQVTKKKTKLEIKREASRPKMNNQQLSYQEIAEFVSLLKYVRNTLQYSFTQMEDLLGIHRTTISRWERGLYVPNENINTLKEILNYAVKKLA